MKDYNYTPVYVVLNAGNVLERKAMASRLQGTCLKEQGLGMGGGRTVFSNLPHPHSG